MTILERKGENVRMIRYLKIRKVTSVFTFATALIVALVTFVFKSSAVALPVPIKVPIPVPPHPFLPEANTGLVLIPTVIAVLLVSSLQLFRKRAVQK